eukprot:5992208-Amphidinium_carterae.1
MSTLSLRIRTTSTCCKADMSLKDAVRSCLTSLAPQSGQPADHAPHAALRLLVPKPTAHELPIECGHTITLSLERTCRLILRLE